MCSGDRPSRSGEGAVDGGDVERDRLLERGPEDAPHHLVPDDDGQGEVPSAALSGLSDSQGAGDGEGVRATAGAEVRELIIDWVEKNKTIPAQTDNNWRIVGAQ